MSGTRQQVAEQDHWTGTAENLSLGRGRRLSVAARPPPTAPEMSEAQRLTRAIETEIIPRLMLAHRSAARRFPETVTADRPATSEDAAELARLSIAHDLSLARTFLDSLRSDGMPLDDVVLHVLAPAARLLGDLWLRDLCRFTDVTVGLCRLQQLARDLGPDFERPASDLGGGPRVVLAAAPGEQHVFGLIVLEQFLRRDGWDVWAGSKNIERRLPRLLKREWIGAVGLTVSVDRLVEPLRQHIEVLRRASVNPDLVVIVGGSIAGEEDDLAVRVGANAAPPDVYETLDYLRSNLGPANGARIR